MMVMPFDDLTGRKIGSWTVVECVDRKNRKWACQCTCGYTRIYTASGIRGFTERSSCGCAKGDKIRVGDIRTNNKGFKYEVKEVKSATDITVLFLEPNTCQVQTTAHYIRTGVLANPVEPTIAGIAFTGRGKYNSADHVDYFSKWYSIWRRVYTEVDKNPSKNGCYVDADICEEWRNFQNFAEWMENQNPDPSWHLDKDLLVKGNKLYSPDTCTFLPMEINMFFTSRKSKRGGCPIGVSYRAKTGRYLVQGTFGGHQEFLGSYATPEEGFYAYKARKEEFAKELAEKWRDKIDPRAYEALMNYTVEITD